jgi:hypothetical protein
VNWRALSGLNVPEGECYASNIEWRGAVRPKEHRIMVVNDGDRASAVTLKLRFR